MKLIVGLGNPGEQYEGTRHNLGFIVVDKILKDFQPVDKTIWKNETKLKSDIAIFDWQPKQKESQKIILAKPQTYMNNSGLAVSLIASYYKIQSEDIWIIHDELDLPVGTIKIRLGGAAAGHHGVESIIASLGTDAFWRFRLGIGVGNEKHSSRASRENGGVEKLISRRKIHDVEDYVLGKFGTEDRSKVKELIKYGSEAIETALEKGMTAAMNRFNTK